MSYLIITLCIIALGVVMEIKYPTKPQPKKRKRKRGNNTQIRKSNGRFG